MIDPTEEVRRALIAEGQPERAAASATKHWTTSELGEEFTVLAFAAPFVLVMRKSDNVKGTLQFTHSPRLYFNFEADRP